MRKTFFVIPLLLSVLAWAESPFEGTWTGDLKGSIFNQDIQNPLKILKQNGIFQYSDINVKADGKTLTMQSESKELGRTTMFIGTKQ